MFCKFPAFVGGRRGLLLGGAIEAPAVSAARTVLESLEGCVYALQDACGLHAPVGICSGPHDGQDACVASGAQLGLLISAGDSYLVVQ